jgi:hypothetical protein
LSGGFANAHGKETVAVHYVAKRALPCVTTRQRLCRVVWGLCRAFSSHGKACYSGSDTLLVPQRLDLAAMKVHHFVMANSCAGSLVYRMLFTDGDEREVPLPQPSLFSICRMPWSRSKEELDEQLRFLGFHRQ